MTKFELRWGNPQQPVVYDSHKITWSSPTATGGNESIGGAATSYTTNFLADNTYWTFVVEGRRGTNLDGTPKICDTITASRVSFTCPAYDTNMYSTADGTSSSYGMTLKNLGGVTAAEFMLLKSSDPFTGFTEVTGQRRNVAALNGLITVKYDGLIHDTYYKIRVFTLTVNNIQGGLQMCETAAIKINNPPPPTSCPPITDFTITSTAQ